VTLSRDSTRIPDILGFAFPFLVINLPSGSGLPNNQSLTVPILALFAPVFPSTVEKIVRSDRSHERPYTSTLCCVTAAAAAALLLLSLWPFFSEFVGCVWVSPYLSLSLKGTRDYLSSWTTLS
jgi:hypothetical protein